MANLGPRVRLEVQVAFQDAVKNLLLALTPERWHPAEQDVQDDSTAPYVCLVTIMPPQHLCQQVCFQIALSVSAEVTQALCVLQPDSIKPFTVWLNATCDAAAPVLQDKQSE